MARRSETRRRQTGADAQAPTPSRDAFGGRFSPLNDVQLAQICAAVFQILDGIGVSDVPVPILKIFQDAGGVLDGNRVLLPQHVVKAALADLSRPVVLFAQDPSWDLDLSQMRTYTGSGGASPLVVDLETGAFRSSTLADLADAARLCDALEHCHFFSRSLVARDLDTERGLDLNTALACLVSTRKHVMVSASQPEHVAAIADIAYQVAGGEAAFRARPFLSMNINHIVPPLRFHAESAEVMVAAVKAGIPVHCNIFGQLGASSPVTMAGSVAQTIAEALAGVVLAWAVDPSATVIGGPRPMITDLRTGGMSGGSGEQGLATAMATQVMTHFGLANSVIAGATDSKETDAQSGFEKAMSVTLAAQSGANLITQALGTQAGLMAASFTAYVIDNDMCGAILRTAAPVEVSDETLALDSIASVVRGEGHFLGQPATYARMKTDFRYPNVANRMGTDEWILAGRPAIADVAKARAQEILAQPRPHHVPIAVQDAIIEKYGLKRVG
jgi:trimethylamine--corrinoid protein Co-methyltransferase